MNRRPEPGQAPAVKRKAKAPKLPIPTEHESQAAFFRRVFLDNRTRALPIYAVPNFSGRLGNVPPIAAIRQAQKLNAEGRKKGVPDICVDVPMRVQIMADDPVWRHGLRIEMKRKGEKATPEQLDWHAKLRLHDYEVAVCYSADEAWERLCTYLDIPLTPISR